jgi:hypothetical protein
VSTVASDAAAAAEEEDAVNENAATDADETPAEVERMEAPAARMVRTGFMPTGSMDGKKAASYKRFD